ncbi:carbon-nitrogen hydrolase [Blastocladiella britannica]|nr:carbon-nitrogen hydrolase [Blastocladiella britannica]
MPRQITVGVFQFSPVHKNVDRNFAYATEYLSDVEHGGLDILLLPEMCFTGYTFTSHEDIAPFVESPVHGRTVKWCQEQARRMGAWVVAGFPSVDPESGLYYNSQCVVDRTGTVVTIYHKHFLFMVDEHWATEGPSFRVVKDTEFGTLGFGICMDLNPQRFESSLYLCEFGRFHHTKGTDLVLCSMAWLKTRPPSSSSSAGENEEEQLLSYWIERLRPLDSTGCGVVMCNRVGSEGPTTFAGASAVIMFHGDGQGIEAGHVGEEEGLYALTVDLPNVAAPSL